MIERFGENQEPVSDEQLALEKYGLEFDRMAAQMGTKSEPVAREKYAREQFAKRGIGEIATDARPGDLELSRAEKGPVSAKATEGKSERIAAVNPDVITRPGDQQFNEQVSPGNYSGAPIPEDLLERPENDRPGA